MLDPASSSDVPGVAMPLPPTRVSGAIGEPSEMLDSLRCAFLSGSVVAIEFE